MFSCDVTKIEGSKAELESRTCGSSLDTLNGKDDIVHVRALAEGFLYHHSCHYFTFILEKVTCRWRFPVCFLCIVIREWNNILFQQLTISDSPQYNVSSPYSQKS